MTNQEKRSETLESYFEKSEARKLLVKSLKINLEMLLPTLTKSEMNAVMRMNLIIIRQCLQDHGVE